MTPTERHALAVAFGERRAELAKTAEWYATNPIGREWTDLAAENAIRLDELDRLALVVQVASMPSECASDYLGGPGCTCPNVVVR